MARSPRRALSPQEETMMRVIWKRGPCTAEQVRQELSATQPLKDSTVRTVLRRLEEKGYLTHEVEGRTYIYRERVAAQRAAIQGVRQIVERFCGGSVERLLVGMVGDRMLTTEQLENLARKIARAEEEGSKP
jgi:BlaI family transcriptional regulator, penicillinase repressor